MRVAGGKTCPSVIFSTTNPTAAGPGDRQATKCLKQGTTFQIVSLLQAFPVDLELFYERSVPAAEATCPDQPNLLNVSAPRGS